jgi:hypothetical protein
VARTQATGSPVEAQGASVAELWATYEGLDAEYASQVQEADRCWSAYEVASGRQREARDAAHAAYLEWHAAVSGR